MEPFQPNSVHSKIHYYKKKSNHAVSGKRTKSGGERIDFEMSVRPRKLTFDSMGCRAPTVAECNSLAQSDSPVTGLFIALSADWRWNWLNAEMIVQDRLIISRGSEVNERVKMARMRWLWFESVWVYSTQTRTTSCDGTVGDHPLVSLILRYMRVGKWSSSIYPLRLSTGLKIWQNSWRTQNSHKAQVVHLYSRGGNNLPLSQIITFPCLISRGKVLSWIIFATEPCRRAIWFELRPWSNIISAGAYLPRRL